ncbi:tetratricopeptide repeat protein [Candidatus Daviesbacteria bacterium]|nr:tetratricopeptide repeat protein [Candidatus Daviesbacteria bacterium]
MFILDILKSTTAQILLIIFLTVLAYSNIFQNSFVGDDYVFIINWDKAHKIDFIPKMFMGESAPEGHQAVYRPIRSSILTLLYQIWGLNPWGYHLYSLFVIIFSTVLVYFITRQIVYVARGPAAAVSRRVSSVVPLPAGTRRDPSAASPLATSFIPFITALLFGLHPIHVESITFMLGAMDSTGALFFLLSFYFWIIRSDKIIFFYFSLFFAGAAYFTNEITITLPLVILAYEYFFNFDNRKKPFKLKNFNLFLTHVTAWFFYLIFRIFILGVHFKGEYLGGSFYLTMLTMVKALIKYIQIFIWPNNLSTYPTIAPGIESYTGLYAPMGKIMTQSIFDPDILVYLVFFGALFFATFHFRKKFPLLSFSIAWFFISLLPVSGIFPLDTLVQERYAYLSSFGYCLFLGWAFLKIFNIKHQNFYVKYFALFIFLVLISSYFYFIYGRNQDFRNQITFWGKLASQAPNNPLINYYLAAEYQYAGRDMEAIRYFEKVLQVAPNAPDVYFRLGQIDQKKGNLEEAIINYQKALRFDPGYLPAQQALGDQVKK